METGLSMEIRIPKNIRFLAPLLGAFRGFMGLFAFTEGPEKMELALEEAFSAVLGGGDPSENISISFRRVPLGIRVILSLSEAPSLKESLEEAESRENSRDSGPHAMGLFLMKHLVDRVSVTDQESFGTQIHLFRRYVALKKGVPPSGEAGAVAPEQSLTVTESDFKDSPEKISQEIPEAFSLQELTFRDASKISAFLSTLPLRMGSFLQYAYQSEDIGSLIREGLLIPLGALDSRGKILALGALGVQEEWGDRLFWILPMMSRNLQNSPRREPLLEDLEGAVLEKAKKLGRKELFALIPRNEFQGLERCTRLGFRESGGVDAYFDRIDPRGVLLFKPLGKMEGQDLHPPGDYAPEIRRICQELGLQARFPKPSLKPEAFSLRQSMITLDVDHSRHRAFLTVLRYDVDLLVQIRRHLEKLSGQGVGCMLIRLPLESPGTAFLEGVEKLGFHFAGILPGVGGGTELLLQWRGEVSQES